MSTTSAIDIHALPTRPIDENLFSPVPSFQFPISISKIERTIRPGLLLQNRYRVVQQLGSGGFGQAYEVDDRGTLKVLKVLNLERFYDWELKQKAVSLFQREATVLSRLHHPGIPKVEPNGYFTLTSETGDALHCLVMEKIEGQTLRQWLESRDNQPLTQKQAIAWLKQLAEILAQVHQQDLVHRDIKPSNIMLRPNGQLVLIDFGAVRAITDTYLHRQRTDATGTIIISRGYTPLEQVEGKAVPQSDFFALGRTFVYLLTGKSPTNFPQDLRTGKLNWQGSALQVSQELADLMDDLMATFPGRRPQTIQEILHCLGETVCGLSQSTQSSRGTQQFSRELPPQVTLPSQLIVAQKRKSKSFLISNFLASYLPTAALPSASPWQRIELHRTLVGHSDVVQAVAISPDGRTLASGSYDKTIKLWDLGTGKLRQTLAGHTHRITCIAISPDGQLLASGSYDRTIKLWNLGTGKVLHTLTGDSDLIRHLAFSPNGQMLISIALHIKVWAVRTGKLLRTLTGHSNSARFVAFSPDGRTCVFGSLDGTIELWNPHNSKPLRILSNSVGGASSGISSLAFSPDGETLASGCGTGVQLWNLRTGKQVRSLSAASVGMNGTTTVAIHPDGQTLASGCGTIIQLWELRSGKPLCTLSGHSKPVESIAFSPDRKMLVSASNDQTIKIWRTAQ